MCICVLKIAGYTRVKTVSKNFSTILLGSQKGLLVGTHIFVNKKVVTRNVRKSKIKTKKPNATRDRYSDDPADWKLTQELIDHFTRNPPSQNFDKDLHKSARSYTAKTRYVQKTAC